MHYQINNNIHRQKINNSKNNNKQRKERHIKDGSGWLGTHLSYQNVQLVLSGIPNFSVSSNVTRDVGDSLGLANNVASSSSCLERFWLPGMAMKSLFVAPNLLSAITVPSQS